jgi:transposase InsO family protein
MGSEALAKGARMAWGTVNVQEQRVAFVLKARSGENTMQALCQQFGISRPTGYHWLRRFGEGGLEAVKELSRRPQHSPTQTPMEIEQRVVQLRLQRPDWGARKLKLLLAQQRIELPAITIHRILLRRGLVRDEDRHRTATQRYQRSAPNQMWQMDFKSPVGWQAPAGPLSVLDDHSRYAIDLHGTWSTQAEPVKQRLIKAFERCGMPEEMLMDHGTPWWNMKAVAGWTWLTVWMMRHGIRLRFSGYRHPQTQGKVERFHGALDRAMWRRGVPRREDRQRWLDEFRDEYNHLRPHQALEMKTPAQVWTPSAKAYVANPPNWEYESQAEVHQLSSQGQLQLKNRRWDISRALAGEWVKLERINERVLVYYCASVIRELDLATQRSTAVDLWVCPPAPPANV